jgi:hypothetical protein
MNELKMNELTEINGGGIWDIIKDTAMKAAINKGINWVVHEAETHPPKNYGPDYNSTSRLL